jgi:hypothetical protein
MSVLGTIAAVGVAGSVISGVVGSKAATKAATVQADASTQAAILQKQAADEALAFQREQWTTAQGQIAPWLGVGTSAVTNLASLMGLPYNPPSTTVGAGAPGTIPGAATPTGLPAGGLPPEGNVPLAAGDNRFANSKLAQIQAMEDPTANIDVAPGVPPGTVGDVPPVNGEVPVTSSAQGTPPAGSSLVNPELGAFGSLMQPFGQEFTAPTDVTQQNDPGYAFRLKEGQRLLENSAAARGGLLTGSTAQDIQRYGQDYASNEYSNVYNRALGEYMNRYNIYNQDQTTQFNRLATMSGVGQTAAGQLVNAGGNAANNATNILLTSAGQQGNSLQNAAAARASGYVGSANAWGGAIQGGARSLQDILAMQYYGRP